MHRCVCALCSVCCADLEDFSACPKGHFANQTGQAACHQCPAHSITTFEGQTSCQGKMLVYSVSANCDKPLCKQSVPQAKDFINHKKASQLALTAGKVTSCCAFGVLKQSSQLLRLHIGYALIVATRTCGYCPPGSYQDQAASTFCKSCQAGTYSTRSSTLCSPCTPGKYSAFRASACLDCVPGKIQPRSRQNTCNTCDAGKFQPQAGVTACATCGLGRTVTKDNSACEGEGLSGFEMVVPCLAVICSHLVQMTIVPCRRHSASHKRANCSYYCGATGPDLPLPSSDCNGQS